MKSWFFKFAGKVNYLALGLDLQLSTHNIGQEGILSTGLASHNSEYNTWFTSGQTSHEWSRHIYQAQLIVIIAHWLCSSVYLIGASIITIAQIT